MKQQPAQRTNVTPQQVLEAMAQAYADFFHASKDPTALLILLSQSAFETGWWKGMWNNNLGNYKAVANGVVDWTYFKCWEMVAPAQVLPAWRGNPLVTIEDAPAADGRLKVWFSPDHPACCFASFPSLAAAAQYYLTKLVRSYSDPNDGGPKDAWHWAVAGDVGAFTAALRTHGYFTADATEYANGVKGCKTRLEGMGLDFDHLPEWRAEDAPTPIIHPSIFNDLDDSDNNS